MSRYYDDELYHFGIKGMHWGVRRYQNANGSYTSAGKRRRRTESETRSETTEKKPLLSPGKKRAIKIGAAAVAAGLAIYGGHKIRSNIRINRIAKDVTKKAVDDLISKDTYDLLDAREAAREARSKVGLTIGESFNYPAEKVIKDFTDLNSNKYKEEAKKLANKIKQEKKQYNKEMFKYRTDRYTRAFGKPIYFDPLDTYYPNPRLKRPDYYIDWVGFGSKKKK